MALSNVPTPAVLVTVTTSSSVVPSFQVPLTTLKVTSTVSTTASNVLNAFIVDIVETGSTLRENGLEVLEEICPLSARMVVNQVSMKMENEKITKLIRELKEVL